MEHRNYKKSKRTNLAFSFRKKQKHKTGENLENKSYFNMYGNALNIK